MPPIYFGTDGIRGRANRPPLTPDFALNLGIAAAAALRPPYSPAHRPLAIIGQDTRASGDLYTCALAAGLNAMGIDALVAGVVPTPAVSHLVRHHHAAFGIVVSASHNPAADNGIKFFLADGYKPSQTQELAIERHLIALLDGGAPPSLASGTNTGRTSALPDAADEYVEFVLELAGPLDLSGLTVAVDAANGAAFQTTPAVLSDLGARVITHHADPDGTNINDDCGCTYPDTIAALTSNLGADIGLAHDGDADRALFCDETGSTLSGDEFLGIVALDWLAAGKLSQDTLVATIMSNLGLDAALRRAGGKVARSGVGDREVMRVMLDTRASFGGEESGHFIVKDLNPTGDGLIAALQLFEIVTRTGTPLSQLRTTIPLFPQAKRYLPVREKPPLDQLTEANHLIAETEAHFGQDGRVLLRYSGTEPKIRLLLEGPDPDYLESQADKIAQALTAQIGT